MVIIIENELKRLSRSDLIEIIYQYQQREEELLEENRVLQETLASRQIEIEKAGSIAEAALALNGVFEAAQKAADQYLANVKQIAKDT